MVYKPFAWFTYLSTQFNFPNKRFNKACAPNLYRCKRCNNPMAWINNLCAQYYSSYARDDNPRERFINSCKRNNNPCARHNNPCARYNNPYSQNNNPFAQYNNTWARNNNMSARFNNSCKRNKNPCTRYNKPYARDNNPFSRYNILSANLTIYVNWLVYSSDSITKEPNGHALLTWVYVFLYKYVSVGNRQSPLLTYRLSSSTDHICLYYMYFCRRSPKQFLPKLLWILINNLIGLSYMTTCRSPVGQIREENKDQDLIHDAERHCPV